MSEQPSRPLSDDALARIKRRRKHFARKHAYADAFASAGLELVAEKLRDCEETEILVACTACQTHWWILNRCRLRICPLCSWRVAQERGNFVTALARELKFPKLLTLTLPRWTGDPRDGVAFLRKSFKKLRASPLFANVKAGVYNIELKPKEDGWHIHIHTLIDAPFIPQQRLFSAWSKVTGIDVPQVDVRAATTPKARQYVSKYASKSAAFDTAPDAVVRWYLATKGLRLFATFGDWYKRTPDSVLHPDDDPDAPCVCPHCHAVGTIFRARDGPFIFGHDLWESVKPVYVGPEGDTRPLPHRSLLLSE